MSLAALFLAVTGFIGANSLRRPADIVLRPQIEAPKPQDTSPAEVSAPEESFQVASETKEPPLGLSGTIRKTPPARKKPPTRQPEERSEVIPEAPPEVNQDPVAQDRSMEHSLPVTSTPRKPASSTPKKTLSAFGVSINSASQAALETLPGIGPATAKKIIAYRKTNGYFRTIDQLLDVNGIGPKKLAQIRPYVRL